MYRQLRRCSLQQVLGSYRPVFLRSNAAADAGSADTGSNTAANASHARFKLHSWPGARSISSWWVRELPTWDVLHGRQGVQRLCM